jgi:hypothetical protein
MTKEEAMDEILEAVRRGLLAQKTPGDTGAELASAMANVIADMVLDSPDPKDSLSPTVEALQEYLEAELADK